MRVVRCAHARGQVLNHFDHFSQIEGKENEWNELLTGVSQRLRSQLLTDTNRELLNSPLFVEITKTASSRKAMIIAMLEKMRILVLTPPDIAVHEGYEPKGFFVIAKGECHVRSAGRNAGHGGTLPTSHVMPRHCR